MTNQTLFELMSEIDFDLIERAEAPVPLRKKPVFRVAMIAAVIALLLGVSTLTVTVAGAVVSVQAVRYVENKYPAYDGTVLHFAQIFLTEDDNAISALLGEDAKHALGGFIAALRNDSHENEESIGEEETETPEEQTDEPEEETGDKVGQDTEQTTETQTESTEPEESTTHAPVPPAIVVHPSYDNLYMIAGDREIEVFSEYASWNSKVNVSDPEVTHLRLYGWMAFGHTTPGTYGYSIDRGERVFDQSFSQEADGTVHAVSKYMGGKSCSRMEVLIPIADLAPGSHRVSICVKSVEGKEVEALIFTVVIPDGGEETETEPEITDEEPEQGWSEGLEYTKETQDGKTVYVVSGIGECTDTELYIPPTHQGCRVVAIGERAFMDNITIVSVTLPSTIEQIDYHGFYGCVQLEKITLSENLTGIGQGAFMNCSELFSVIIPKKVKSIEAYAFAYCYDLESVSFAGEVEEIGTYAFSSCYALSQITFPQSVQSIGRHALSQTPITEFVIPERTLVIESATFYNCIQMKSVTIHSGVTKMEDGAFMSCDALQTVYYYGTVAEWNSIQMSEQIREQLTPLVVYVEE